jgi:phage-related protein
MLTLPSVLILEKNKLVSTLPWVTLLEITLPTPQDGTSVIRLAQNNDIVPYAGNDWTPYAFKLSERGQSGDGKIQSVSLQVANPARALTPFIEAQGGLVGAQVRIIVVHAGNLGVDYTALTLAYIVLACTPGDEWATFQLGAESPMRKRFPLLAANPMHCSWNALGQFKGVECAYTGGDTACEGTLAACRTKSNSKRFGGRPGAQGSPRFV